MAFMLTCTNKGCGKTNAPVLDIKDNEVYCSECGNIIKNISHFTKTQMKSLKQINKPAKASYSVRCDKCKQDLRPKIENNILVCGNCSNPNLNVSKPFELLIRNAIKDGDEEL
jgi:Zn finger protein HypA/HybF involved in hydrogenase expression